MKFYEMKIYNKKNILTINGQKGIYFMSLKFHQFTTLIKTHSVINGNFLRNGNVLTSSKIFIKNNGWIMNNNLKEYKMKYFFEEEDCIFEEEASLNDNFSLSITSLTYSMFNDNFYFLTTNSVLIFSESNE